MKRCLQCNPVETDEALKFCRVDGVTLISDSSPISSEAGTAQLGSTDVSEVHTSILPHNTHANVNRTTGPTTTLPIPPVAWGKAGIIVFAPDYSKPLMQVSAQGGEPKLVEMQGDHSNKDHRSPYFLPDGRRFLFPWSGNLWVGSLDSPEKKQIGDVRSPAVYTPQGWLIFVQNDALMAQAFDTGKLALSGEPIPIITGAANHPNSRRFSVSDNGVLVLADLTDPGTSYLD